MAVNKDSVDTFVSLFDYESVGTAKADWSPNQFRYVLLGDGHAELIDFYGASDVLEFNQPLSPEDFKASLDQRRLGCLEGIFLSSGRGGAAMAHQFLQAFPQQSRIHAFGLVEPNGEVTSMQEDEGRIGWEDRIPLQPEHYAADAQDGKLHRAILASMGGSGEGEESGDLDDEDEASVEASGEIGEEAPSGEANQGIDEDTAAQRQWVTEYFTGSVKATIDSIILEYNRIFASGYGVVTPAGVLLENEKGRGVLGHLVGEGLVQDRVERNLQFLYEHIKSTMNLVEVPVRNIPDIANVIVKGHTLDGTKYVGTPYFPYKMLEYAYGRERMDPSKTTLEEYPPHANSATWPGYANSEVRKSLTDIIHHTLWVSLVEAGCEDEPEGDPANDVAKDLFDKFKKAFCTCLLVTSFDVTASNLVKVKLRVLDPTMTLSRSRNVVAEVLSQSHGSMVGNDNVLKYEPKSAGEFFVEYAIDLDRRLANAEPLFAYKALAKVRDQGGKIDFNNTILGKDRDDNIVQNGKDISFSRNLSHLCIAGSRAGKGVWTFSILGSSIVSGRATPYLDNKPDMASTFLKYGPNGFVVNGANLTYDKENGTDYFGQFRNADDWVDKGKIPRYVKDLVGSGSYSELGSYAYAKGLIMAMGIIAARVVAPEQIQHLGGEQGVTIVVDELANANNGFMNLLSKIGVVLANTGYYNEMKARDEEGSTKKPNADKPLKEGYWAALVYEKVLKESLIELHSLSNAGMKNSEAGLSDVFVLTQEPPSLVTNSEEAMALFQNRNKNSNGRNGITDSRILPSFALLGGTDAFIGYDKDHSPGFLAQKDKRSPAYPYLNAEARNFAYIPSYGPDTPDEVNNARFGENRLYYKPFLLFADADQDEYFVKNALKVAHDAGIPDTSVIIKRNASDHDPNTINPGVGFKGYLNQAGIDDANIEKRMNASGDIADYITKALGYPGTWRDLILDMRPEWQFGIRDIIAAIRDGVRMQDTVRDRLQEFIYVYPEEFPDLAPVGGDDGEGGNLDFSGYEGGAGGNEGFVDQGDDWEKKRGVGVVGGVAIGGSRGGNPFANPVSAGSASGGAVGGGASVRLDPNNEPGYTHPNSPVNTYNDVIGAEGAYYTHGSNTDPVTGDTIPLDNDDDEEFLTSRETVIPNASHDGNTEDLHEELVVQDWRKDGDEAENYLRSRQRAGAYGQGIGRHVYGDGVYPLADGKVYRMGPIKSLSVKMRGRFDAKSPSTVQTLMKAVTSGSYALIGGPARLNSLRVLDGSLTVNNTRYKPSFNDEYLATMPRDLRVEVLDGKVARLFMWRTLKDDARGVKRLYFDDVSFVADYVSEGLGWRGRISVDAFFSEFTRLQSLTIGDQTFKRSTYKQDLARDNTFYQPAAMRRLADAIDRGGVYGAKGSVGWMQRGLRRSDIGFLAKTGYVVAGLTGAAVSGTVGVSAKGGKATGSGVRNALSRIRDMMSEK